MITYPSNQFLRVKSIIGATAVDATADAVAIPNRPCTVVCLAGNLWINPITTAVADATAYKMTAGMTLNLSVLSTLSVISDESGATYEIIVWDF